MQVFTEYTKAIEKLMADKLYPKALGKLKGIKITELCPDDRAKYNLLYVEAKIRYGEYDVDENIKMAMNYYKYGNDNNNYGKAKYLYGLLLISKGKNREAIESLLEAYAAYNRCDDIYGCSQVLNRLAFVNLQDGAIEESIKNLEKSISINEQIARPDKVAALKRNLATVFTKVGELRQSINHYKHILENKKSLPENHQYHLYLSYAMAMALKGDIKKAMRLIARTQQFPDDYKREKALYHEYLGWIYNLDEQFDKAVETLNTGIELSMKIAPESDLISQSKRLLADALIGLGKFDRAEQAASKALAVAEKINERVEIAACYRVFARVEQARRNGAGCREWYGKAMEIFPQIKSRYELAVTRYLAAESGFYGNAERSALLYLAREYFESEDVVSYVQKVQLAIDRIEAGPAVTANGNDNGTVFIAADQRMMKIVEMARNVARSEMTILLTGPTGSGKDQLARYIHQCSGRTGRFVTINSAAIPESMVEAELFGFKKGAYTGADHENPGLLKRAQNGTFYLNEIADAPGKFQAKLLEVIENKTIRPLGGGDEMEVDIRIIAATNCDLEKRIREGRFRPDLYHRLNVIPISLPALAERPDDIPALVKYFLGCHNFDSNQNGDADIVSSLCWALKRKIWAGNVRELKSVIDRLFIVCGFDITRMLDIVQSNYMGKIEKFIESEDDPDDRDRLIAVLEKTGWNKSKAARNLGMSEGAIRYRMKKYDLDSEGNS